MSNVEELMEKKFTFRTLVKKNHELGDNMMVVGRIHGYKEVLCDELDKSQYAVAGINEGIILTTKCTLEQYEEFTRVVKKRFPDLCEFNYGKFGK